MEHDGEDRERSSFEVRVLAAIEQYRQVATVASNKKISINAFMKHAGISRSSLYAEYKHLVPVVRYHLDDMARQDAELLQLRPSGISKKQVIADRKDYKKNLSKLASAKLTQALKDLGPAFRDRKQLVMEIREKDRIISEQENTINNQQDRLHEMMRPIEGGRK